ncbi:metal-chelation protein CHAD [Acidovorax sp. Root275]|uniref:CYTH and CHAD domain-containing protein n=1 Tax=Acidovorax sp. Root275 TaxID=1736508 RepID=UPI00070EFF9A|nr:CYTH and CHAD domain-containing protein [Acidovorax sp. Root275]KRD55100.1 metal-chelation protein CHAD [Acidovorax sp. Root275]
MEIEFKFCIPPERLAVVQAAARRGTHAQIRMEARYFDTPDAALSSRGIAFRLRREGNQWVQTVKALGDGPLDREEHNVDRGQAHATGPAPEPQPELHAGTVAGTRLLHALQAATGPLTETYGTEMDRVTRDIAFKGGVVELALDTGRVIAHRGKPQQKEARICELELELKAGPLAGLAALATRWATRHGLFLSTVSKAERGERLLAPQWARPATKAAPMKASAPQKHFLQGRELQRTVVAHCLQQILGNASEIVEGGGDEEHVHQLRIGIRRLRTALRELAPLAPGAFDPAWEPTLVEVFQRLGQLRDRGQALQPIVAEMRDAGAPALEVRAAMKEAPGPCTAAIVRTPAFQAALIALMAFTARGLDAPSATGGEALDAKDVRRLLQKRMRSLHAKVRAGAQGFAALPAEEQHHLRKRLKRLRYLTEFVEPALDAEGHAFLASLQPALAAMGRLGDERVACTLYGQVAATHPRAWFGVGWLTARQALTIAACQEALGHIADMPHLHKTAQR